MRGNDSATESRSIAVGGMALAALGVLVFSFSLPATVCALDGLDPYFVSIGRAALAALLAAPALAVVSVRSSGRGLPARRDLPGLLGAGLGVVFGFPVLSTLALDHGASAAHSAVVVGLLPAATAFFAVLRGGERPSPAFWAAAAVGALTITAFTLIQGGGSFTVADLLLVGALIVCGYGYAEGGRLARRMPGWQVISWALVVAAPISVPVTVVLLIGGEQHWTARALFGFGYVAAFSMFLGFFAWYAGMGRIGVARAGQFQLAQPILTLLWSAALLGERLDGVTWLAAIAVVVCVAWTQRARVGGTPGAPARPGTAGHPRATTSFGPVR